MSSGPYTVQRTGTPNASHGSSTITTNHQGPSVPFNLQGTLRLRAASDAERDSQTITQPRVQWAEDVVDNEGMGKKSSKVCCIYHKPRETGESSSEESSSSSDDSDSEPDTSRAQPANRRSAGHRHHRHTSDSEPCEHEHGPADSKKEGKQKERKRSPNAYERVPKRKQPKAAK